MSDAAAHVPSPRAAFLPASMVGRLNDAIEALIGLLDALTPDCDLEEDDPQGDGRARGFVESEPSVGPTSAIDQTVAWKG